MRGSQGYVPWVLLVVIGVLLLGIQTFSSGLDARLTWVLYGTGTLATLAGAGGIGRTNGLNDARDLVEPIAGPAFRRTFRLYEGLGDHLNLIREKRQQLSVETSSPNEEKTSLRIDGVLEVLETQVSEQIRSSNDAAAEWEAIFPDKVRNLRAEAKAKNRGDAEDRG